MRRRLISLCLGTGGIAIAVAAYSIGTVWDAVLTAPLGPDEALPVAARLLVLPAALLFLMAAGVMAGRLISGAFDPLTDREGRFLRVSQRILTNTIEQTAIFVPAFLATAALADGALRTLPLIALLFVLARILFWGGYLIGPFWRAPGMAMTLTVNGGLLVHAAGRLPASFVS